MTRFTLLEPIKLRIPLVPWDGLSKDEQSSTCRDRVRNIRLYITVKVLHIIYRPAIYVM
jgi:hypothetical protein